MLSYLARARRTVRVIQVLVAASKSMSNGGECEEVYVGFGSDGLWAGVQLLGLAA
jgi:hypothetical protein